MKRKLLGLSQRYVAALRNDLKAQGRLARPNPAALSLGREAVALGLETLELARLHGRALLTLKISPIRRGLRKRAGRFFSEANALLAESKRAGLRGQFSVGQPLEVLRQCPVKLAATQRQLQRSMAQSKVGADAAKKSDQRHRRCLAESLLLQKLLRQLTHRALTAQEDGRTRLSHKLQDEIAQTLLGINVRLLSLKQNSRQNIKELKNQIASAQQLVLKSAQSVRRFARELDAPVTAAKRSGRKFV